LVIKFAGKLFSEGTTRQIFASKMQVTNRKSAQTGDSPFTDKYYLQIFTEV
jgi:hypothetical protein